ncbi:MAG: ribonucleoside triphosphate reductase [Candidatus Micrarchaeota archaeon]
MIRKRNGQIVEYEEEKIRGAIAKAFEAVNESRTDLIDSVVKKAVAHLPQEELLDIEVIQDAVEQALVASNLYRVAKAYILYRKQHQDLRQMGFILGSNELVDNYINLLDWRVKENSNMSFSMQGLNNHVSGIITSNYWLTKLYPENIRLHQENGDFHIHDLGTLGAYCCGWDLADLLTRGFGGVSGKLESKPPKRFRTALGQVVNFFYTLQGESAGAQAFSNFDTYLAPFIANENLSYEEVKQGIQEFVFNMNVPTRVGFQTPFTNLTIDLTCPKTLKDLPAIIGGKAYKKNLGEFQDEMDMLNRAFCEVMTEGDARGRVFTFPIPTYNISKDFDWDNPKLEPLWEMTSKYGIPYFANFVNSDLTPEDARSMCLHPEEEIVVKMDGHIQRTTLGELVDSRGVEGWAPCAEKIEALSLNNEYKIEWAQVKNFLKVRERGMRLIRTRDGKFARYSLHHPLMVLTPNGLEQKLAKDVVLGDYLVSLKSAERALQDNRQFIGCFELDEKLAFLLGLFVADGNYLFKHKTKSLLGMQLTFNEKDVELRNKVKEIVKELFAHSLKEKKDPRYNTHYLYLYKKDLASLFFSVGFKKYGRLPSIVFDSPKEVIGAFLEGFFAGDGYAKRQEIHINDKVLVRDLSLLYSLVGIPNTIKFRENSQILYLQHKKSSHNTLSQPVNCLNEMVPGFLAKSTYAVPGLSKNRMVGLATLQKYSAVTVLSEKIASSDIYPVPVIEIQEFDSVQEFYDIELEKNNLFVHSLGTLSHNCCRLRLDNRELRSRGGGLFGANPLTGSIGVVTLNLPRLGFLAKSEKEFFEKLDELMGVSMQSLIIKRKVLEKFTSLGLYPYSKHYLSHIFEQSGTYWGNHFSTIGLVGMNECLENLLHCNIASVQGKAFAEKTLEHMRERIRMFQVQTGELFNLEATPAEGASYRLAQLDKQHYPEIRVANEDFWQKDHAVAPYYTNSSQLPVQFTEDVFEALDLQDSLQTKYTGGTVLHFFVGEQKPSSQGVKELVRTVTAKYHLPYFTLTPTFSICPSHGYQAGEHFACPQCQRACEVFSRIVGYFRPVQNWNAGKREEFKDRVLYKLAKVR